MRNRKWDLVALALTLTLGIGHVLGSWGYLGLWWEDHGRWLHEVDRFASGQVLYRDFYWPFPPLGLWIVGGAARVFGSNVGPVTVTTAVVFLAICACYYAYSRKLVSGELLPLTIVAGLLFAFADASKKGSALPLGMYTPAAPIGFLFLILATLILIDERRTLGRGVLVGALAGACILTKQDFWFPAAYVVIAYALTAPRADRVRSFLLTAGSAVGVVAIGAAIVAATAGAAILPGVATGFGHVAEFGGRALPSWERITASVIASALVIALACFCIVVATGNRRYLRGATLAALCFVLGLALYVAMSGPSKARIIFNVTAQLLPMWLPAVALIFVYLRRDTLDERQFRMFALLLGLAVVAHVRRLFQGADWYHFLLEIPLYVLLLQVMLPLPHIRRAIAYMLAICIAAGVVEYYTAGRGPLTRGGVLAKVQTTRGPIRVPPQAADDYRWLESTMDAADPGRTRGVFAFGYNGGFAYFLSRPNPSPVTQGFRLSPWPPEEIVQKVRAAQPFLIDIRMFRRAQVEAPRLSLNTWAQPLVLGHYERFDRPYFEELLRTCPHEIARRPVKQKVPFFTVYDCSATALAN